jgi:hypothetical protein
MTTHRPSLQRRHLLRGFAALAIAAAMPAFAKTAARTPGQEIEALIQRVATARGVTFIRNGSEYTAADAATHLRRKLRAADGKITTPEQFIDALGSRSSMSGRPYRVRLADGREMDSATWLNGLLRDLRAGR